MGCGLVLGAIIGGIWFFSGYVPPWFVLVPSVIVGLVGYRYGDAFWAWFAEHGQYWFG